MPNNFYAHGREAFATAQINWPTDTINVTLVDTDVDTGGYTPDLDADQFFGVAVPTTARIATQPLGTPTAALGVLDGEDVTFPTVTGNEAEALVIWKDTGDPNTSPLLLYIDTATGLPVIPNGGDIDVEWDAAGIGTL